MNTPTKIDQELKQATEALVGAADTLNIDALEGLYASEFEGLRMDKAGTIVRFTKDEILPFYKRLIETNPVAPQTKDTKITFAERTGQQGFVLMVRTKILSTDWETISYNLYWERRDDKWRLVKEFAFHDQFKESPTFSAANWLGVTEKTFDTGELTINYAEGPASGPAMVMLHGGTRWWQDWYKFIPTLKTDWHIYACDLRGHGKSGRDSDHYRLTDYVRDIVAMLRQQVNEPAVLVGHSLGALTAIGAAAQAPDCVRALVLLDPPLFLRNSTLDLVPYIKEWMTIVYQLTSSVSSYEEMVEAVRSFSPGDDETSIKMKADNLYGIAPETANIQLRDQLLEGFDLEQAFRQIQCPVLLFQADWSQGGVGRDEDADLVKATHTDTVVVKFSGAGHQLQEERSEEVLAAMANFLKS
jgi:pimeloyl-ACP methyl ester carboxylesterase